VEEVADIQTKGTGNAFNEIIAEKSPRIKWYRYSSILISDRADFKQK
jgi:hypothetical protein